MVAESFRDPGERMPIAGLGVVGLCGAAFRHGAALETTTPRASAWSPPDNFGPVRHRHTDRRRPAVLAISGPTIRARAAAGAASTTR